MPQIDLTWNLFFTAILIPILGWFIKRLIDKSDKYQDERHETIVKAINENRDLLMEKLEAQCEAYEKFQDAQEKLHRSIDERFWRHAHADGGDVIIRGDAKGL